MSSLDKSVKSDGNCVFVLDLTARADKINDKGTKVNEVLQCKDGTINLPFIYNSNIYSNMLNTSGLHLCDHGTTRFVNNFCYVLNKSCKQSCMENTLPKERET